MENMQQTLSETNDGHLTIINKVEAGFIPYKITISSGPLNIVMLDMENHRTHTVAWQTEEVLEEAEANAFADSIFDLQMSAMSEDY
jgi:hypothetical protein